MRRNAVRLSLTHKEANPVTQEELKPLSEGDRRLRLIQRSHSTLFTTRVINGHFQKNPTSGQSAQFSSDFRVFFGLAVFTFCFN